jgi:predicted transcriptional regulator
MTEDQKAISLILDLLNASRQVPRTLAWIESEVKLAGRRCEVATILETMEESELVTKNKDAIGIRRYLITPAGRDALADL